MTSGNEFLLTLQSQYTDFSQVERKIADAVKESLENIPDMTVTELAERSEVSEASIIRFAKKIGFTGYYQMKIAVIRSMPIGGASDMVRSHFQNDIDSVKKRTEEIVLSNIANTYKMIDQKELERAVEQIEKAESICFFAAGNSLPAALDASYKFGKLGFRTFCETVPERALLQARNMQCGELAFGISRSGSSKQVVLALTILKRNNIASIILTNYTKSPCSSLSDTVLITSSHETMFAGETVITRLSETAVIDLIYYMILLKRNNSVQESLTESEYDQSAYSL